MDPVETHVSAFGEKEQLIIMNARTLYCEQAVFTSTRMPTGEGYRITACSRGLRPDIKQVITRHSPSEDALCWSPEPSGGA